MSDNQPSPYFGAHIVTDQDPESKAALLRLLGSQPPTQPDPAEVAMASFFGDTDSAHDDVEAPDLAAYADPNSEVRKKERELLGELADERIQDDKVSLWTVSVEGEEVRSTGSLFGDVFEPAVKRGAKASPVTSTQQVAGGSPEKPVPIAPLFGTGLQAPRAELQQLPTQPERRKFSFRQKAAAIGLAILTLAGAVAGALYATSGSDTAKDSVATTKPVGDVLPSTSLDTQEITTSTNTSTSTSTTTSTTTTTLAVQPASAPSTLGSRLTGASQDRDSQHVFDSLQPAQADTVATTVTVTSGDNLTKLVKQQLFGEGSGAVVDGNRILSEIVRQGVQEVSQSNNLQSSKADILHSGQTVQIRWSADFQSKVDAGRRAYERLKA